MKILQINASARSAGANSTRLADSVTARLLAQHPHAEVEMRDLASNPHPVLDEPALGALFTPADQRTAEQSARVALDDALIAQVQAVDTIVLGVPMYNFGVPVQLKTWIDAIARAGVTFRYTENGPEGLHAGRFPGAISEERAGFPGADGCRVHLRRRLGDGCRLCQQGICRSGGTY
jgi:FMN-dependent NADH-azoreductase